VFSFFEVERILNIREGTELKKRQLRVGFAPAEGKRGGERWKSLIFFVFVTNQSGF